MHRYFYFIPNFERRSYGWKMESFLSAVVNTIPINYKEKKNQIYLKKKKKTFTAIFDRF